MLWVVSHCDTVADMTNDIRFDEVLSHVAATYPNADLVPVVIIPWGDDASGMMVDHEGDAIRIGLYADLSEGDDAVAMLECPSASAAIEAIEYLTDEQPEGTDWLAWAAQRIADGGVLFTSPCCGATILVSDVHGDAVCGQCYAEVVL